MGTFYDRKQERDRIIDAFNVKHPHLHAWRVDRYGLVHFILDEPFEVDGILYDPRLRSKWAFITIKDDDFPLGDHQPVGLTLADYPEDHPVGEDHE